MAAIDRLESDYVLKASAAELDAYYVSKVTIEPLSLDDPSRYIEPQNGTTIDVSNDLNRAIFPARRARIKGTALVAVPFTRRLDRARLNRGSNGYRANGLWDSNLRRPGKAAR
jgi:hypothetical protein